MKRRAYWRAVAERAIKTAAQVAVLTIGGDVVNAFDLEWENILGLSLGGALLSVLTSLASSELGGDSGPSIGGQELLAPELTPGARRADPGPPGAPY